MAKRLTDTDKWRKPFVKGLSAEYKLLWLYMIDDCDFCGIWQVDLEIAQMRIGCSYSYERALQLFKDKVVVVDPGVKWFIPDFIKFQYGEQLVIANRMHKPIIDKLTKLDLLHHVECDVVEQGTSANAMRSRVTQKVKDRIFLRDEFTCQYCSVQFPKQELVVDHILPISKKGDSVDDNLCSSCMRCNRYKSDYTLQQFIEKNHSFVKLTDKIQNLLEGASKVLYAPYNLLEGAKDKEQYKDKDKDKDLIGGLGDFSSNNLPVKKPPFEDVHALFVRNGKTEAEAKTFYNYYDGLGWMKGVTPILNWTAIANNWIANPISQKQSILQTAANPNEWSELLKSKQQ